MTDRPDTDVYGNDEWFSQYDTEEEFAEYLRDWMEENAGTRDLKEGNRRMAVKQERDADKGAF